MDNQPLERHSSVTPLLEVPQYGLSRLLADWSGVGSLYRAIAGVGPSTPFDREWTVVDVERRAMRVLLLQCQPLLAQWPSTMTAWLDQLPLVSTRHRYWSDRPVPKVDWVRTRARRGWPPELFAIKRRHRATDQIPLAVLRWTLDELSHAVEMARQLVGAKATISQIVDEAIAPQLETALGLKDVVPADDIGMPSIEDLAAIRGLGWPWNSIASVAAMLLSRYRREGMARLAKGLISPDGFPDRLFQLAVLGTVLTAAEEAGAVVTSVRPIGDMTAGPVYQLRDSQGRVWDVWCEAERCWDTYGIQDPYYDLAASLSYVDGKAYQRRHLRPDILVALPGARAMVIECKYPFLSADPGYVATGASQAYFYGMQLHSGFPVTHAVVVGPDEMVRTTVEQQIGEINLAISSPALIGERIPSFFGE